MGEISEKCPKSAMYYLNDPLFLKKPEYPVGSLLKNVNNFENNCVFGSCFYNVELEQDT